MGGLNEYVLNEVIKLIRNKINSIYIAIIGIAIIASAFGVEIIEDANNANTGYSYFLFSLQTLSSIILPFLLLLFASSSISSEVSSKTIRNILVLNASRVKFFISKITVCLLFQLIIVTIACLLAFLIGYSFFGFGNIIDEGIVITSQQHFWIQFLISYCLLNIVLLAITSFGIFASTIISNNIGAIIMSIGSYILIEAIKTKLHIENFLYSTYLEFPLGMLSDRVEGFTVSWKPYLANLLTIPILWIFLFLFTSFLVFRKREFK